MAEAWDPEKGPFNQTCTGWLGRKRATMLTNPLLVRQIPVGKPHTRRHKLPSIDHTYGMALIDRTNTVRQACAGWGLINVPEDHGTKNRSVLRKEQFARSIESKVDGEEVERPPTPTIHPNTVYGVRPPFYDEKMSEVLTNTFQKEFLRETKTGNKCFLDAFKATQMKNKEKYKTGSYLYENRATQLRKSSKIDKVEPLEPWRMRRFLEVAPHLSTFRTSDALERAVKADSFERVGREGIWGHGITTKAKSRR